MFGFGRSRQAKAALEVKLNLLYTDWCVWGNTSPSPTNYEQFIADLDFRRD